MNFRCNALDERLEAQCGALGAAVDQVGDGSRGFQAQIVPVVEANKREQEEALGAVASELTRSIEKLHGDLVETDGKLTDELSMLNSQVWIPHVPDTFWSAVPNTFWRAVTASASSALVCATCRWREYS